MASPCGLSIHQGNGISYMVAPSSQSECSKRGHVRTTSLLTASPGLPENHPAPSAGGGSPGSLWEGHTFEDGRLWRLPAAEAGSPASGDVVCLGKAEDRARSPDASHVTRKFLEKCILLCFMVTMILGNVSFLIQWLPLETTHL